MKRIGLASVIALGVLLPLAGYAEEPAVVAAAVPKWADVPPAAGLPKGTQMAMLFGDMTKDGQYAYRLKLLAGAKIAPHTHPNDENITVLSGALKVGVGEKFDAAKMQTLSAGGFVRVPKGVPHYAMTTQATIIQFNSVGPSGLTYLDPADAPTKK